ncbi:unnamed protein product, partial [Leptidea sinapis]
MWLAPHVESVVRHLDDSYESNKVLALELLHACPVHLLQDSKYSNSLNIQRIFEQASCVKPTECTSAAYKLLLVINRLSSTLLTDDSVEVERPERASYIALSRIASELAQQVRVCEDS